MPELRPTLEPLAAAGAVVPTWNEAESVGFVIAELLAAGVGAVVISDGGSSDGTQEIARRAGATVVDAGRGYGRACATGAAALPDRCSIVVFLDGDGADRGDLVGQLLEPIARGTHDFVIASRSRGAREPGSMSGHQLLAGRLAGAAMAMLYGVRYTDMCAFRAIRRDALAGLGMREMSYGWNIEMQMRAARRKLRVLEVPMPYRRRIGGASKVAGSLRGSLRAAWRIALTFGRVATAKRAG